MVQTMNVSMNVLLSRHIIVTTSFTKINDEGNVALREDAAIWKEKLPALLSDYEELDIFNFDKAASFFKMMLIVITKPWQ